MRRRRFPDRRVAPRILAGLQSGRSDRLQVAAMSVLATQWEPSGRLRVGTVEPALAERAGAAMHVLLFRQSPCSRVGRILQALERGDLAFSEPERLARSDFNVPVAAQQPR
jgi:hypothetical protein